MIQGLRRFTHLMVATATLLAMIVCRRRLCLAQATNSVCFRRRVARQLADCDVGGGYFLAKQLIFGAIAIVVPVLNMLLHMRKSTIFKHTYKAEFWTKLDGDPHRICDCYSGDWWGRTILVAFLSRTQVAASMLPNSTKTSFIVWS